MELASDIEYDLDYYKYDGCEDCSVNPNYWTTKDGRKLIIVDLDDNHIVNICRKFPNAIYVKQEAIKRGLLPKDYSLHPQYKWENQNNFWK